MLSKAQKEAFRRYDSKFVQVRVRVSRETREKWQDYARSKGVSLNALIIDLMKKETGF